MEELATLVVGGGAAVLAVVVAYLLYIQLPADMARGRNRDPLGWVLVSLLGCPIVAILLLWIVGDAELEEQDEA